MACSVVSWSDLAAPLPQILLPPPSAPLAVRSVESELAGAQAGVDGPFANFDLSELRKDFLALPHRLTDAAAFCLISSVFARRSRAVS